MFLFYDDVAHYSCSWYFWLSVARAYVGIANPGHWSLLSCGSITQYKGNDTRESGYLMHKMLKDSLTPWYQNITTRTISVLNENMLSKLQNILALFDNEIVCLIPLDCRIAVVPNDVIGFFIGWDARQLKTVGRTDLLWCLQQRWSSPPSPHQHYPHLIIITWMMSNCDLVFKLYI